MQILNNEKGFIYISLFLSLLTAVIALPLLMNLLEATNINDLYDHHSINTFFHLINRELPFVKNYDIGSNSIIFISYNDDVISISKYNHLIRRQVNGLGHEVYLRDVKNFSLEKEFHGFKMTVETLKGDVFEKRFSFYNF